MREKNPIFGGLGIIAAAGVAAFFIGSRIWKKTTRLPHAIIHFGFSKKKVWHNIPFAGEEAKAVQQYEDQKDLSSPYEQNLLKIIDKYLPLRIIIRSNHRFSHQAVDQIDI